MKLISEYLSTKINHSIDNIKFNIETPYEKNEDEALKSQFLLWDKSILDKIQKVDILVDYINDEDDSVTVVITIKSSSYTNDYLFIIDNVKNQCINSSIEFTYNEWEQINTSSWPLGEIIKLLKKYI